jgi:hypothetical protein
MIRSHTPKPPEIKCVMFLLATVHDRTPVADRLFGIQ